MSLQQRQVTALKRLQFYGNQFHDIDLSEFESTSDWRLQLEECSGKKRRALLAALNIGETNDYVTDSNNRRRFHGAFTGGFSAGYHNTVGSEEGFKPSQFFSSRQSRSVRGAQRVQDFLDEEDVLDSAVSRVRALGDSVMPLNTSSTLALPAGGDYQHVSNARKSLINFLTLSEDSDSIGGHLFNMRGGFIRGCPFMKAQDACFQRLVFHLKPNMNRSPHRRSQRSSHAINETREDAGHMPMGARPQVHPAILHQLRSAADSEISAEGSLQPEDIYDKRTLRTFDEWSKCIEGYMEVCEAIRTGRHGLDVKSDTNKMASDSALYLNSCKVSVIPSDVLASDEGSLQPLAITAEEFKVSGSHLNRSNASGRDNKRKADVLRMADVLVPSTHEMYHRVFSKDAGGRIPTKRDERPRGLRSLIIERDRLDMSDDEDMLDDAQETYNFYADEEPKNDDAGGDRDQSSEGETDVTHGPRRLLLQMEKSVSRLRRSRDCLAGFIRGKAMAHLGAIAAYFAVTDETGSPPQSVLHGRNEGLAQGLPMDRAQDISSRRDRDLWRASNNGDEGVEHPAQSPMSSKARETPLWKHSYSAGALSSLLDVGLKDRFTHPASSTEAVTKTQKPPVEVKPTRIWESREFVSEWTPSAALSKSLNIPFSEPMRRQNQSRNEMLHKIMSYFEALQLDTSYSKNFNFPQIRCLDPTS